MILDDAKNLVKSLDNGIKTFVSNVSYYPKDTLYVPNPNEESVLERFAKGIGIGSQEIGKSRTTPYTARHGYRTHLGHTPQDGEFFLTYSHPFFHKVENTAYAPLRDTAVDSGIKSPNNLVGTNKAPVISGLNLDEYTTRNSNELPWDHDLASLLGYGVGSMSADIVGHGLRKLFWNMNPEDALGTFTGLMTANPKTIESLGLTPTPLLSNAVRFGTAAGLGITVGNWDPTNLSQGGRPAGYEAITPDEDPRQSTQPVTDLLISRGLLGRNARLLPWEQFRQERPDVTYDEYQTYQNYLYNRDPGALSRATFGLVKGTPEGIDGDSPELRVLGYRVTPEGIVGAGLGASVPLLAAKYIKDNKGQIDDVGEVVSNAVRRAF
jgi:hypothetical protein